MKAPMTRIKFITKMKVLYGWAEHMANQQYDLFLKGVRDHNLHDNTCYYLVTYD